MAPVISFTVPGIPQPQGSARAFMPKGRGRFPVVTSDNPKLKGWRKDVSRLAQCAYRGAALEGPMALVVAFYLPAPKALKALRPHVTRPDVDKLARAIGDALTGIVWRDDSQVAELSVSKQYAAHGTEPRAEIRVTVIG